MSKPLVITIDGPVGAGKSVVARRLAARLGFRYLDTGAMYRAVTLKALREKIDLADEEALTRVARAARIELAGTLDEPHVLLDGEDVTAEIRSLEVTNHSFYPSQTAGVRQRMVELQRAAAASGNLVAEGRDMSTVVFPDSPAKFYLDASVDERAQRRHAELVARGESISLEELRAQIIQRDERDSTRAASPLRRADDAAYIDSTGVSIDGVIGRMVAVLAEKGLLGTDSRTGGTPVLQAARRDSDNTGGTPVPRADDEPMRPGPGRAVFYALSRLTVRIAFGFFFRMRAYGQENVPPAGGALLLANHQSYLDPPIIGAGLRRRLRYMARYTLYDNPILGTTIDLLGAFPVRPGKPDKASIRRAIAELRAGQIVVMFPEGTRSWDGELLPMQGGFRLLVRKANVPVIPVAIDGVHRAWPRARRLPRPGRVRVLYGLPIPAAEIAGLSDEEAAERMTREITALYEKLRRLS